MTIGLFSAFLLVSFFIPCFDKVDRLDPSLIDSCRRHCGHCEVSLSKLLPVVIISQEIGPSGYLLTIYDTWTKVSCDTATIIFNLTTRAKTAFDTRFFTSEIFTSFNITCTITGRSTSGVYFPSVALKSWESKSQTYVSQMLRTGAHDKPVTNGVGNRGGT